MHSSSPLKQPRHLVSVPAKRCRSKRNGRLKTLRAKVTPRQRERRAKKWKSRRREPMPRYFCLTIRFLQPYSHGRGEDGQPEWPPSPLRAFQALVAAAASRWNERVRVNHAAPALQWLERLPAPTIIASAGKVSSKPYLLYI